MKKIIFVTTLFITVSVSLYAERISIDKLPFELSIPHNTTEEITFESSAISLQEARQQEEVRRDFFKTNRYTYKIQRYSFDQMKAGVSSGMYSENFQVLLRNSMNFSDLKASFTQLNKGDIIAKSYGALSKWCHKIDINDEIVGEYYFYYSREENYVPTSFQYTITILHKGYLYRIIYDFNDFDQNIPRTYPELFVNQNSGWFLPEGDFDFYFELTGGSLSEIPEYNEFVEGWEEILYSVLSSLEIHP